jgi:hypothetical protein
MSKYTRSQHVKDSIVSTQSMLSKVQAELADRYVEVEREGISLARLVCIYLAGAREARIRTVHSLRSLFGLRHAH